MFGAYILFPLDGKYEEQYMEHRFYKSIDTVNIGIIVDSVEQVLDIDKSQISPIPVEDQQGLTNGMISLSSQEVLLFLNCEELIRTY